jgi:sec-independent protein translocase protein TatC
MSTSDDIEDSAAPLLEHLAELRTRLIYSVAAFFVAWMACFAVSGPILEFLLQPIENSLRNLGDANPTMQYTAPQEYFFTLIRVSVVAGLIVAFPIIAFQLWRFVAPGLYKNEKNAFLPFLLSSPILFLLGAAFAHFVVVPLAMAFFLGFADFPSMFQAFVNENFVPPTDGAGAAQVVAPVVDNGITIVFDGKVNETLDITLKLILAFGICFQLPVLLTLLGTAGLASSRGLRHVRKYAIVGIMILAAVVTPPDVITQLILFAVVYGLYEISIHLVKGVENRKDRKARADGIIGEDESLFDIDDDEDEDDDLEATEEPKA